MGRRWLWVVDVVWVVVLAGYIWGGYRVVPFHGDESINIGMSADFHYRYLGGDLDRLLYSDTPENPVEQSYRINDSPFPRYLIGLGWYGAGFSVDDLNLPWWFAQSYQWNVDNGFYPGDALLLASRVPSTVFAMVGCVGLFVLGYVVAGRPAAYTASLYFALNPAILVNVRRAMHEGVHLGLQVMILLCAVAWLWAFARGGRVWLLLGISLVLGLLGGLGIAGKHTNVLVFGVVILVITGYTLVQQRGQWLMALGGLAVVGVASVGAFLYWNPPLWGDPVGRTVMVAAGRAEVLADQVATFENSYQGSVWLSVQGLWRLMLVGEPLYYEAPEWADYIGGQIATYEATIWGGVPFPYYNVALLPLVVLGAWHLRRLSVVARWVLWGWGGFIFIYSVFLVPLGWQRYYLPALPVYGLFAGLGVAWVVASVTKRATAG